MDSRTGELYNVFENGDIETLKNKLVDQKVNDVASELTAMEKEEIKKNLIPVKRNLSIVEKANRQIMLYQPCACGSGKKLKFCCFKKPNPAPEEKK